MMTTNALTYIEINGTRHLVPSAVADVIRSLLDDQARLINSHQVLQQAIQSLRDRLRRLSDLN
jgi:hypothetical protein